MSQKLQLNVLKTGVASFGTSKAATRDSKTPLTQDQRGQSHGSVDDQLGFHIFSLQLPRGGDI